MKLNSIAPISKSNETAITLKYQSAITIAEELGMKVRKDH